jgi:putative DNA primase/helicase
MSDNLADLIDRLQSRCADIAIALLGEPNKRLSSKRELRWGGHGKIRLRLHTGRWDDYSGGYVCNGKSYGDMLNLIVAVHRCGVRDAITIGRQLLGDMPTENFREPSRPPATSIDDVELAEKRRKQALQWWDDADQIEGTPAKIYFYNRLIEVPDDLSGRVLRYHPRCPWRDTKVPALLALFTSIVDDRPTGILRIALTLSGHQAFGKGNSKLARGPTKGAAIKLSPDESVSTGLCIAEGIETGLAAMAFGYLPMWAIGGICDFPVIPGIEALTLIIDHDQPNKKGKRAGQDAANVCRQRWIDAGREVLGKIPPQPGEDAADMLARRCGT